MTEQIEMPEETMLPQGVGPQLRLAREKLGLSIKDVAEQTRISSRNIEIIEAGNFSALPGRTYAIGFARSMAKVVELDQNDVVEMVRAELNTLVPEHRERRDTYEPGDPGRVPSGRLVWFSILAVVLLAAGLYAANRAYIAELPILVAEEDAEAEAEAEALAAAEQEAEATPADTVIFTALDDGVWVRFYNAEGLRLMETELAQGETYTVPADVEGPQLWTGRPDALAISVGGQAIAPLADRQVTMRDVPVDAASLLARPAPGEDSGDSNGALGGAASQ